jgi:hypothetical protein
VAQTDWSYGRAYRKKRHRVADNLPEQQSANRQAIHPYPAVGLSNQQIERYARQIIVPGIGGIAQERLLSSRLLLAGSAVDVASVLAYMVGAGVGQIHLLLPSSDKVEQDLLITQMRDLNGDVIVKEAPAIFEPLNLIFAIGRDVETFEMVVKRKVGIEVPLLVVNLETPPRMAIFPSRPPCPLCADASLLEGGSSPSDNGGFVAMVAATQAFKLLSGLAPMPSPMLLEFDGFACTIRDLKQKPLSVPCACSIQGSRGINGRSEPSKQRPAI